MDSPRLLAIGRFPKLPNLILVFLLLLVAHGTATTQQMAPQLVSTSVLQNGSEFVSPTPTMKLQSEHLNQTTHPIVSVKPSKTTSTSISQPIYGLGAQPRLFISPEKDNAAFGHLDRNALPPAPEPDAGPALSARANEGNQLNKTVMVKLNSATENNSEVVTSDLILLSSLVISSTKVSSTVQTDLITFSPVASERIASKAVSSSEEPRSSSWPSALNSSGTLMETPMLSSKVDRKGNYSQKVTIEASQPETTPHFPNTDRFVLESSLRTVEPGSSFGVLVTPTMDSAKLETILENATLSSGSHINGVVSPTLSFPTASVSPESPRVPHIKTLASELLVGSALNGTMPVSRNGSMPPDGLERLPDNDDFHSVDESHNSTAGNSTEGITLAITPTSSSNFTTFAERTTANVLMMSTAESNSIGQPSSEGQVQKEETLPAGTVAGIVVASIGFIAILAAALGLFVIKRIRGLSSKTYDSKFGGDSCSYLDSLQVSYINNHTEMPKESSEEMFSLDNDSFLNSLEAMTMENYWAEDRKSTKV